MEKISECKQEGDIFSIRHCPSEQLEDRHLVFQKPQAYQGPCITVLSPPSGSFFNSHFTALLVQMKNRHNSPSPFYHDKTSIHGAVYFKNVTDTLKDKFTYKGGTM
jgi:hypothetical protein